MKSTRRSSALTTTQGRSNSIRHHGRVTKEDIRAAGLRRWDGRARVTTDWVNLFYEPELFFPDGDLLIYLREPGQSSRGPSFRVHKAKLQEKGFDFLLERCISRPPLHAGTKCMMSSCPGCDIHVTPSELYIPAPPNSDLDSTFDHHITTRNFFAWLYVLPLAGRALGRSLVTLKERIDYYRPDESAQSSLDIISFAETQRYLDFRECVDHALAILTFAECLQIEDLWIDAFAHCVGMSHRGLNTSIEYWAVSYETRLLINQAQEELEMRIFATRSSMYDFFESDLSGNFLGLSQQARDHFDHFRSWLHSYYIEQYGFWPPEGFEDAAVERDVYAVIYTDFRNLYHHLVDPDSSAGMMNLRLSDSGGVCTVQNIQAFDSRHHYESLPQIMPLLPREPDSGAKHNALQRRKSWNPVTRRRADKENRKALRAQALIAASNRDWSIMNCSLVRRYSELESQIAVSDFEGITMVDGRKVRWILIYAVLQTLISVMQTPGQVRNGNGVTYLLCCRPPSRLPWQTRRTQDEPPTLQKRKSIIEPDNQYNHSNASSSESLDSKPARPLSKQLKEIKRQSLPARLSSISGRPTSSSRAPSIKSFMKRRHSSKDEQPPVPKVSGYCEILVQGYGNGLNEVDVTQTEADGVNTDNDGHDDDLPQQLSETIQAFDHETAPSTMQTLEMAEKIPELSPPSSTTVSRESSNASSNSAWHKTASTSLGDLRAAFMTPVQGKSLVSLPDLTNPKMTVNHNVPEVEDSARRSSQDLNHVVDEDGLVRTIHFNTETWDNFLTAME